MAELSPDGQVTFIKRGAQKIGYKDPAFSQVRGATASPLLLPALPLPLAPCSVCPLSLPSPLPLALLASSFSVPQLPSLCRITTAAVS